MLLNVLEVVLKEDVKSIKDEVSKIRDDDLKNLKENLKKAIENLEENNFIVHHVKKEKFKEEFLDLVDGICVKSKTNLGRELEILKILRENKMEAFETDLGDFIVDFLNFESSYPILPAAHLSFEEIKERLEKKGIKVKDIKDLINFVRKFLFEKILKASVGITGANFISSEGSVFLVENEGNVSLITRIPRKHIVIAGWEKITKNDLTALKLCKAQIFFSTGLRKTSYVNIISGPSSTSDIEGKRFFGVHGAEEVHVFLIRRDEIFDSEFREILKCINCGSCSNYCPAFPFGIKRKGIIGLLYESFYEDREKVMREIYKCSLCGFCKEICPAGIDHLKLIKLLREKLHKERLNTEINLLMIKNIKNYGNPIGEVVEGEKINLFCC